MRAGLVTLTCLLAAGSAQASGSVVAVFDIQAPSDGRVTAKVVKQLSVYLSGQLAEIGAFRIVPSSTLREQLSSQKSESYKACYDEACQIEIGKAVAAEKALSTELMRVGNTCVLKSVLYDLRQEVSEKVATVKTGCKEDELLVGIESLVAKLSGVAPAPAAVAARQPAAAPVVAPPPATAAPPVEGKAASPQDTAARRDELGAAIVGAILKGTATMNAEVEFVEAKAKGRLSAKFSMSEVQLKDSGCRLDLLVKVELGIDAPGSTGFPSLPAERLSLDLRAIDPDTIAAQDAFVAWERSFASMPGVKLLRTTFSPERVMKVGASARAGYRIHPKFDPAKATPDTLEFQLLLAPEEKADAVAAQLRQLVQACAAL